MRGAVYLAAKSILFVGDPGNHIALITHALSRGYQILCAEVFKDEFPLLNQENVKLVIIGDTNGSSDAIEDCSLAYLTRSEIPVILAKDDGFAGIVMEAFQDQLSDTATGSSGTEQIKGAIELFLNGEEREATDNNHLTLEQKGGFVSLELDANAQELQKRIKRAIAFMEEHYSDGISLKQIARAAFLSSYHFCRLFRKQMGITCSRYLSILRIRKAKELLRQTELSVTEICYEAGFNSLTHFERVFKKLEGTTPSAYRQCC
jgi:AraC-like DNA-binding protein